MSDERVPWEGEMPLWGCPRCGWKGDEAEMTFGHEQGVYCPECHHDDLAPFPDESSAAAEGETT